MAGLITSLLLLCSISVFAQTHQHAPAATGDGRFNPFVASDGRGGFYLVYIERQGGKSDVMLRHTSDGATFSAPIRVNVRAGDAAVRNENPPKVAVGPQGDVYVCWANERERWRGDIRFARSIDGGKTFSPAITINSDAAGAPTGHAFQSIAVDRQGNIYLVWIDERNKRREDRGAEIWLAKSTDRGRTFSRDRRILGDVCECCRTNLQIDRSGNLYLAYRTVPRTGPMYRDIVVARSQDGGASFTPVIVSEDKWEINGCPVAGPSLSVNEDGRIVVVWFKGGSENPGLYYATSADSGSSYTSRRALTDKERMGKHAHTAVAKNGQIFVAWDEAEGERTWSAWRMLDGSDSAPQAANRQAGASYPIVAANEKLALVVAWKPAEREIFMRAIRFE